MAGLFISTFLSIISEAINISRPKAAGMANAALRDHFKPTKIANAFGITPPRARQTQEITAKS
jgi:hypothetical protein